MNAYNSFISGPKAHQNFLPNVGEVVVDQVHFRFSLCRSVPEIFAIKVDSCEKLCQILTFFVLPNFVGATLPKFVATLSPLPRAT